MALPLPVDGAAGGAVDVAEGAVAARCALLVALVAWLVTTYPARLALLRARLGAAVGAVIGARLALLRAPVGH